MLWQSRLCQPLRRSALWIAIVASCVCAASELSAFDLQGHRGARGLYPENTIAAFEAAVRHGATTLETDLALTRDGHLVLTHDPLLNPDIVRRSDGEWVGPGIAVRQLTLQEVLRFDVGRLRPMSRYGEQWASQQAVDGLRMPTFDTFAVFVKAQTPPVRINIETKLHPGRPDETASAEEFADAVVAAIRRHALVEQTTVQSFDWRTLLRIRATAADIETGCLTIDTDRMSNVRPPASAPTWTANLSLSAFGGSVPKLVKAAGCAVWSPFWRNLDAAGMAEAIALGLRVVPWTVNVTEDMRRLIDLGVHGLITDYPDRASALLRTLKPQPK